jgi:predicted enzyme related to lactoylglutathione lyase
MNYSNKLLFLAILIAGCNTTTNNKNNIDDKANKPEQKETVINDTTPKVTGIGGIFFGSKNPKETREWYGKNLGLAIDDYGSPFEFRNANRPGEINYLRWSPFENGSDYFAPSAKEFMINYRVQNIEGLVKKLKENGVTIVDKIETFDYGKFVHIMDSDGNKIELWEPGQPGSIKVLIFILNFFQYYFLPAICKSRGVVYS